MSKMKLGQIIRKTHEQSSATGLIRNFEFKADEPLAVFWMAVPRPNASMQH